jgi:ubiquinone/menaquinone biosynthesis C-methylase UbiE
MKEHNLKLAGKPFYSVLLFIYPMEVYDKMAEYYDFIYGDEWDIGFYLNEARNARGSVLEVACGTGRILIALAKEGIDITGFDISQSMLDILKQKANEDGVDVDVYHANMVDFKIDKKFNLIIVPYRSFLHLSSEAERKAALKNFYEHLNPGGRLIIHAYNPSKDELLMSGKFHNFDTEEISRNGKRINLKWYLKYEPEDGAGNYKIVLEDGDKTIEYGMKIYFVSEKQMKTLLERSGYKNIKNYCGFDYTPFNESCREALWIAER